MVADINCDGYGEHMKITTDDAVRALKSIRTAQKASTIALLLGVTSRAVATALRPAVDDGRVTIRWPKRIGGIALYRFVRLKAK
jgi:hypothetical protein